LLERLAYHVFELTDIGLDRALTRRSTGVAFALLRLDPELVVGLLLKVSSAPASAPISSLRAA
jgi:hypothetical protein